MTVTAMFILLISACIHTGWNLLGKRHNPTAASFLAANLVGALSLSSFLFHYQRVLRFFSWQVWLLVLITGVFQTAYYAALAGAYQTGELSLIYPLARSFPVILVPLLNLLSGKHAPISRSALFGMGLIVVGGSLLPMKRFRAARLKNYWQRSSLLALLAALGTTGYSIVDDAALRLLRQTSNLPLRSHEMTIVYAFFEAMTTTFWLTIYVFGQPRGQEDLRRVLRKEWRPAALMGLGIYFAYTLVLVSMAFATNVSYVVAFRQISIPLGVLLGVTLLKETAAPPKFIGVTMMFVGLVLVGMG